MGTASTIYTGEALAVLRTLPDECVDAVITDPPYSSGGTHATSRTGMSSRAKYVGSSARHCLPSFDGDNRDQRSWSYWCALWMGECLRITRPGGVLVCFADWRQLPALTDAVQAGGWVWRGIVPWFKPGARPQRGRFTQSCEFAVWATRGPRATEGPCLPGWVSAPTPNPRTRVHITQKPVPVMRMLVQIAPRGGVVLDPFAGSGSTGVACALEGRDFVGIEADGGNADIARARISETLPGPPADVDVPAQRTVSADVAR